MSDQSTSSVWRIVFSAAMTIYFIVRIAMRCSGASASSEYSKENYQKMQDVLSYTDTERFNSKQRNFNKNIFYESYQKIDSLDLTKREALGIVKLKQDSLVRIDLKTQMKIPKESFFVNNHEDSIRFSAKLKNSTNFFIHNLESSDTTENILKSIKGSSLRNLKKDDMKTSDLTMWNYELNKKQGRYNGILIASSVNGLVDFMEFESPSLSKSELKKEAVHFLSGNIISQ